MKKILIFSDTHGYTNPCIKIIQNTKDLYAVIHAGDCVSDAEDLQYIFPQIPIYNVRGNNDFYSRSPMNKLVTIDKIKIFITHGHEERVKYDLSLSTLKSKAEKYDADLVVFGHTHIPKTEFHGKMTIINPGSVKFSRTYAVAEIENDFVKTTILNIV